MRVPLAACLALLAWALLSAAPLRAGDAAERAILGFSPDGRWFAFEEFGIQDGSGAPYANIFVIDLDLDRWAPGTPVRARLNTDTDPQPPVSAARRQAEAAAARVLKDLAIGEPGIVLGSNPPTEINEEAYQLTVREDYNLKGPEHKLTFNLQVFDAKGSEPCPDPFQGPKGFALTVARGFEPRQELHRDSLIPATRGCPVGYGIADIIRFDPPAAGVAQRLVALVHVYTYGFEGNDVRFIAVPVRLP
jgi:predicted secreted protein